MVNHPSYRGFSLVELLIVVALIAMLAIAAFWNFQAQVARGYDSRRKNDLTAIQKALEQYATDTDTYPTEAQLEFCGSASDATLKKYMDGKDIPCDPTTGQAYKYMKDPIDQYGNACEGYVLLTKLADKSDGAIKELQCDPVEGCGYVGASGFNYGFAQGACSLPGPLLATPPSGPTPTPNFTQGDWFCQYGSDSCSTSACPDTLRSRGCFGFADPDSCGFMCRNAKASYECTNLVCN